jgi:hypothetical protein
MSDTHTFGERLAIAQRGQEALRQVLAMEGFTVAATGQELWLARAVHNDLRFDHSDLMARAIRYAPDFLAYRPGFPLAYWEAKVNSRQSFATGNFAIERACYDEQMARVRKGERVAVAWMEEIDGSWRANWVQCLPILRDLSAQRHAAEGSHTPFLLIDKQQALPLAEFLRNPCAGAGTGAVG